MNRWLVCSIVGLMWGNCLIHAETPWVIYEGSDGPGMDKHIVLVSGDEEYRSEEGLPQLGKILTKHHGFKCTVLFAIDPEDGTIDPDNTRNIPGLQTLRTADLMIIATRFRDLPDEQMKYVAEYIDAGKPVIGMRAAVVAFRLSSKTYECFSCQGGIWKGGFGQHILGQTWKSHHGKHGIESTRGVIVPEAEDHPIVRGCEKDLVSHGCEVEWGGAPRAEDDVLDEKRLLCERWGGDEAEPSDQADGEWDGARFAR